VESEVKTSTTIAFATAMLLSSPPAAYAQTEQPPVHHHTRVHHHHHHEVAHNAAPIPESAAAAQRPEVVESPQPNQMFKPYAQPGEGDDDGLSRDPDDCMKGCIGGNPQ
jgi:hypothetical protein